MSGRERRANPFNHDMRVLEEFAFRHPEGGNSQDFIAAAKATGADKVGDVLTLKVAEGAEKQPFKYYI